ncbi:hypothetical protein Taro_002634 [Colocasia esculenta]|uniref:Ubiquitin-like protease family profile domain-containing protein n=1 Tax=Colocasia esculenta TaxID=4460 RepID=A0A843TLE3_COLES|nr:hypothetical protein [Colocasia esculenta]
MDCLTYFIFYSHMWESTPIEVRDAFTYQDSLCLNAYMNALAIKMSSWTKTSDIFLLVSIHILMTTNHLYPFVISCEIGGTGIFQSYATLEQVLIPTLTNHIKPDSVEYSLEGENTQLSLFILKVPQQNNGEECGIFVLYFIHLFMRDAPKSECSEGYSDFLTGAWFNGEEVDKFDEKVWARWVIT